MRNFRAVAFIVFAMLLISGCGNPVYERNIETAYSKLKVGMTKAELDNLFGRFKFLKEQAIDIYPNSNEKDMRTRINLLDYFTFQVCNGIVKNDGNACLT